MGKEQWIFPMVQEEEVVEPKRRNNNNSSNGKTTSVTMLPAICKLRGRMPNDCCNRPRTVLVFTRKTTSKRSPRK